MSDLMQAGTGSFCMLVSSAAAVWPIDGTFPFETATWVLSTRTLTKTGVFTNYVFAKGDKVQIEATTTFPSGWVPGEYEVESRTSNDAIVLKAPVPNMAGQTPRMLPPNNSTTAGFLFPNPVSGNRGAVSTTASHSIAARARHTIIEEILVLTAFTADTTISVLAHDGTTLIHQYAVEAHAANTFLYPLPIPMGIYGRKVRGGISALTSNAGTTFELFGRVIQ